MLSCRLKRFSRLRLNGMSGIKPLAERYTQLCQLYRAAQVSTGCFLASGKNILVDEDCYGYIPAEESVLATVAA
jgi:hypothetical protein